MKEIDAVAKACGLPTFRYYTFAPVIFEALPAPEESPLAFVESSLAPVEPVALEVAMPNVAMPSVAMPSVAMPSAAMPSAAMPSAVISEPAAPTRTNRYPILQDMAAAPPLAAFMAAKSTRPHRPRREARPAARVALAAVRRE